MAECTDPAVRDQLPVLLHPSRDGDSDARAVAEAHVRVCASCRDELRLLEAVRAATVAPSMNAARIAASLPPYRRAESIRSRWLMPTALAATLIVAVSVVWTRPFTPPARDTAIASAAVAAPVAGELAIGDNLSDLTEADLRALVDELTALEPTLESEPDILLPALDGGSGGEGDL